jgi:hypothetical protein
MFLDVPEGKRSEAHRDSGPRATAIAEPLKRLSDELSANRLQHKSVVLILIP